MPVLRSAFALQSFQFKDNKSVEFCQSFMHVWTFTPANLKIYWEKKMNFDPTTKKRSMVSFDIKIISEFSRCNQLSLNEFFIGKYTFDVVNWIKPFIGSNAKHARPNVQS